MPDAEHKVRRIDAASAAAFAREVIMGPDRRRAVVAVTSPHERDSGWVDAEALARAVADHADVVFVPTGDATWALSEALPPRLDVYGGALRIWWPGVAEDSDPYDHPLLLVANAAKAAHARDRVLEAFGIRTPESERPAAAPRSEPRPARADPARPVRPPRPIGADPVAWRRIEEEYAPGDVVWGRVRDLKPKLGVFVELLPGAVGFVHISQVDYEFVEDPADFVTPGEVVAVGILNLDAENGRCELSIKQALGRSARPPIALEPGGAPFLQPGESRPRGADQDLAERVARLEEELGAAVSDRREAVRRVQDLQKQLRSERSRSQEAEQRAAREDPTASERSFLLGVRLAYARDFGEGDRLAYPLGRMRVGRSFLGTLPNLDRVPLEKLLEVCAQVASGRAHEIPGRSVHPFRTSEQGGAPYRVRARDDAKAWRCSLVDQTAGAPRLHWWSVPGPDGATVEFASVNHHEDFSLPE